jgi:putative endonuclease
MPKQGYVYIVASGRNGTLYIGVTSDMPRRGFQHKGKISGSFTARYKINRLVYFEAHDTMAVAIAREKAMKKWNRAWKIELIEKSNPEWEDLFPE